VLFRLAYLGVTNTLALLRLLPMSDRDKDAEILALRHQIMVLERHLDGERIQFTRADRAWLAALLHPLPRTTLNHLRLLVRLETVLRSHRDLIARRHARRSRPHQAGRPRTIRSIRRLVLRLASENATWGYRRIHGQLLVLGVKVAASTVWEILKDAGVEPAPERTSSTWTVFLRSQAHAIIAADFFETATLTGARLYVLAVIDHATRRIRVLGHRTPDRSLGGTDRPQPGHGTRRRRMPGEIPDPRPGRQIPGPVRHHPRRRRDRRRTQRCPDTPDERDHGTLGTHLPPRPARPDPDPQPAAPTTRAARVRELLQRTPTHQGIANARPPAPLPEPITDPDQLTHLNIHRRDRRGGILHEYEHAA
jgi:hypothetical protein